VATTTAHGTRIDLDALHSLLLALHALAQDVVRQYGGRLHPVMGERLMAMFGVPVAHEDDARRAVRVALELRWRLSARQERLGTAPGAPLALHMGLHTGLVVVGGMRNGDDADTAAAVVGDVVSLATALQERAEPGTILCSDATARLIQGTVRLEALGSLQVPGQPVPVETYTVLGRSSQRSPVERYRGRVLSPFVGREREMTTLHALLAQVEAGRGQVVGVVGEPGLGKSRLIYEFRRSLGRRRLTYRAGRCLSYGTTTPYLPVLDLLRHHCGITDIDGPESITAKMSRSLQEVDMVPETWAPVLLHLLGLQEGTNALAALSPEVRKARTLTALTQICLQGSRQRPLILEIEDLHWIDASSDECLTALIERMAGTPLMVLVTYRPGYRPAWIDKSYVTQVALQPLTSQDSLRVVQAVIPTAAFAAPLVPQLLTKADGNPFFLEELARTVAEQGTDTPAHTVPDTVQAVLLARIDRLPTTAKHLLHAAAVIGKDVALPLLQAVTDVPEEAMHRDLGHLQAAEFLYETYAPTIPTYTFKHALTQEVTYQSLVRRARQQYHERIAQMLEAQPEVTETQPELLAQHYMGAERDIQAIPYWQRAGQRAVERSAHVEAISHFAQGIELLKKLPVTPERIQQELALQLAMGVPLLMIKGHTAPEVEQAYTRAYELAQHLGETPQRFSVLAGLWRFYFNQIKLHTARELAEQCFTLAQHLHEPVSLQEAHLIVGSTAFFMGDPAAAYIHLEQGITLYDPQQSRALAFSRGTDPGVVSLSRLAWTLWWLGYPDRALARSHEAIALAQRLEYPYSLVFALQYHIILCLWLRELSVMQEQIEAAMALEHKHGFVNFLGGKMTMAGWLLVEQGNVEEGFAQIYQGLDLYASQGVKIGLDVNLALLAQAYGKTGRAMEGLRVLDEALAATRNNAEYYYEAELYRLKGELLLQSAPENEQEAESCFRQAIDIARHQQAKSLELRATTSLARWWQTQGKRPEARQILTEVYSCFTEGFETRDLQEAKALIEALQ
jgi:predicted ATPase/class 3 adenylate cyclase